MVIPCAAHSSASVRARRGGLRPRRFDWLLTDLEHGGGDESESPHQQLAADADAVPMLVRVESTDCIRAGHALDLGAAGIMFPGIDRHTRLCRPSGTSATPRTRPRRRHLQPRLRIRPAPRTTRDRRDRVLGIVQIERKLAWSASRITKVPGIDVLFIGPCDLARPRRARRHQARAFQDALQRVLNRRRGRRPRRGILALDAETARRAPTKAAVHRHRLRHAPARPRRQTRRRLRPWYRRS